MPSTVTCRSSMDSSRAAWVLGEARLISSPRTMLAKIAPGLNSKSPRSWLNTLTPVTSEGSRSGVNWMRRTEQSIERARALASIVLPTPGTSSMSRCPSASRATRARRTTSVLPSMTRSMLARILSKEEATSSMPPVSGRVVATAGWLLSWGAEHTDCRRDGQGRGEEDPIRFYPPPVPTATDTRARLLVAARQAFADLGYGRARVEDVVARAGVGHGTFYAYFKNKRAALAALISENATTLVDLAGQPWRPGDVRASLVEVLGGLSDLYDRDADLIALWTEASIQDPELGQVLDEVRRQFVARIARNIEHAAGQGVTRPVDPLTAATALAAMAEQTMFLRAVRGEPLDRDLTVETLADLWLHALYR